MTVPTVEDIKAFCDYDEANSEDLKRWLSRVELYNKVIEILDKIQHDPSYYLSYHNRQLLKEYLKDYEKSILYVS
jgi:hypothetical protein